MLGAAVLVVSQQACGGSDDPPAGGVASGEAVAPSASAVGPAGAEAGTQASAEASAEAGGEATASGEPSAPAGAAPADPLSGSRQLTFVPVVDGKEQAGSVMSVTPAGRADVTDRDGDAALFVPVQVRPGRYQLKTGKLVKSGEPYCLRIKPNGSNPLTVVTAACDASEINQQFRFQKQGGGWLVSSDGVYLTWRPKAKFGLIAEESGDGDDLTSWRLRDRGAAALPKGD